jgi:3-deoxy-D-manno-octulosonic-acid transferase
MPPERVAVSGHTKFDQQIPELTAGEAAAVRAGFGLAPDQPLFLAGSTHEGEEELILDAWESARRRIPDLALMLAPRHLARAAAIRALIEQRGYAVRTRSDTIETADERGCAPMKDDQNKTISASIGVHPRSSCPVLLLDTMGELARFYSLAAVAFVGGSLVPKGGHDILQPLFHGVPTLFGPSMHNQRALVSLCLEAGAARQVAGAEELGMAVVALVGNAEDRKRMLSAAEQLLAENRGASARCAAVVVDLVHSRSDSSSPPEIAPGPSGTGRRAPDPVAPLQP